MDLDTTIKGLLLDRETITKVINDIISIEIGDNIKLEIENIKDIREEELYSGFNVNLKAEFDGLKTNLMIDITTGDVITYKEVEFKYNTLFCNEILRKAIINTAKNREALDYIDDSSKYIELISEDSRLKSLWNSYKSNYDYAKDIEFIDTINAIKVISEVVVPARV